MSVGPRAATVLLSGGIDSAVVLAMLRENSSDPRAIWIDYGQPAAHAERKASKAIAAHYGIQWTELAVAGLMPPQAGEFPGRNDMLVALAASATPGQCIAVGVHAGTSYTDCSPPWFDEWQELLTIQYHGVTRLLAPLINLAKAEVYELAHEFQIPTILTHSCEAAVVPCGGCLSCIDRRMLDAPS